MKTFCSYSVSKKNILQNLVSIIIPTFNRVHFLGATLDSVLSQTYSNWECIVVDDSSTDHTKELVDFYRQETDRFQFHVFHKNGERGAGAARNFGFQKSKGEFVMWLDDDDLLHRDKIRQQVALAREYTNVIITCSWGRFGDKENFQPKNLKIYKDYEEPVNLLIDYGLYNCFFPTHAFLLSRSVVERSGFWRTDLAINDDGEFFSRAILASSEILNAEDTFVMYRLHSFDKMSELDSAQKAEDIIRSWRIIQSNLNTSGLKFPKRYIQNGRKHSYSLLKEAKYESIIFENFIFFRISLFNDFIKRTKKYAQF